MPREPLRGFDPRSLSPLSRGLPESGYIPSSGSGLYSWLSRRVRSAFLRAWYLISWYAVLPTEPSSVLLSSDHRFSSIHSSAKRVRMNRGSVLAGRALGLEGEGCEPLPDVRTTDSPQPAHRRRGCPRRIALSRSRAIRQCLSTARTRRSSR